jgi:hypothetical protein
LEISEINLVGGGRRVRFKSGFNVIQGDISSGKTTLVRLLRAMIGSMPRNLPPEVRNVQAIRGNFSTGARSWQVYRPAVTTHGAIVEIVEEGNGDDSSAEVLRIPVAGTFPNYSSFLLSQLQIPDVKVPQSRRDPNSPPVSLTFTDWLSYCIVTGDELDTEVFGHQNDFQDRKRKYIFEIAYGLYNPELSLLQAELRSIELRMTSMDRESTIRQEFLKGTPFSDIKEIDKQITDLRGQLQAVVSSKMQFRISVESAPGIARVRGDLLNVRKRVSELLDRTGRVRSQISDLEDLRLQLKSQAAQMTRAIVAGEWLVDFDFIVCPRCGNDVDSSHVHPHTCYLCGQETRPAPSTDELLAEQDRITSQLHETEEVLKLRRKSLAEMVSKLSVTESQERTLSLRLDEMTDSFVSDSAALLEEIAAQQSRIETRIVQLNEYRELLERHGSHLSDRFQLEAQHAEIVSQIDGFPQDTTRAHANIQALETRLLEYLQELGIPELGTLLTVDIHPTNFLPRISGRNFDNLSSQGLKTLVNIAHALAHHTVAIDRELPIPGLLVLDGLSSNAGHEGFDRDRVRDVYRLLRRVAREYEGNLQIIAVDNEVAGDIVREFIDDIVLTLTQDKRLLRFSE